jgi:hypothetical protein
MVERKASERGETRSQYYQQFTKVARERLRTVFFLAIPAIALLLAVLFRHRYFVEHLVYSIHFHAFYLVFLSLGIPLLDYGIVRPLDWMELPLERYVLREPGLNYLVFAAGSAYHFPALRRVNSLGPWQALILAPLLMLAEFAYLLAYKWLLFYWVFYTT